MLYIILIIVAVLFLLMTSENKQENFYDYLYDGYWGYPYYRYNSPFRRWRYRWWRSPSYYGRYPYWRNRLGWN